MTAGYNDPHLGLVVEGPGDANALPILLRKVLAREGIYADVLGKPVACNGRQKALAPRGLEGFVAVAAARPGCRAVLVVLDGEGDPVCDVGPQLLARAKSVTSLPVAVCLADCSYEDWLYASCETLDIGLPSYDPSVRGTAAIKQALRPGKYVKPTWQPRLTTKLDPDLVNRRNVSFRRMLEKLKVLTEAVVSYDR
jgi:hypothetical protein